MKLVYILWDDTAYPENCGWRSADEVLEFIKQDFHIKSVGWILKETKKHIILASRMYGENVGHFDKIPKSAILKMKELK